MSSFSEQERSDQAFRDTYRDGQSYRTHEILKAIDAKIGCLNEHDATGHVYWHKFRSLVQSFDPVLAVEHEIEEEIPY